MGDTCLPSLVLTGSCSQQDDCFRDFPADRSSDGAPQSVCKTARPRSINPTDHSRTNARTYKPGCSASVTNCPTGWCRWFRTRPARIKIRSSPHPNGSPVDFGNSVVYSLSNGVSQAIATITSGIPGQVHSSGIPAGNPGFEHQSVDGLPIDPLRIQPSRPRPRPRPSSPESGNFAFTSQSSGSNGRPVVTVEEFASEPDIGLRPGPTRGSGRPSSASAGVVSSGTDFASASGGVSVSSSK